jgi:predicted N-acetyltransferase YhbS
LATGSIIGTAAPGKIKRNMPDPIPVMVLGRLAVDLRHQNQGIGKALVKDAVLRTLQASEIAGIRAILVQAIDERAKDFYAEKCGFVPSTIHPLTLIVTLPDLIKRLGLS